ncbi:unnamed protein product, partial [Mesorhabditis belari]|uniref:K Homology domain-containing protein n=1 Tax=Mesorhabditis belari TaxID=2138241 RepID=A0AAF3FKQ9_9BILA
MVPVDKYPKYNFVGRILGPRGMTARQLEEETGCKIMVRGRGNHGPTEPLHIIVQCEDIESLVEEKMRNAIEKINVLLHPLYPEGKDELKRKQLVELSIINGTYRPTAATKNALQTPRPHVLPSGGIISPQALAFTPRDKPTKMSMEKKKVNDILHQNQLMSMMALFQPTTTRQESNVMLRQLLDLQSPLSPVDYASPLIAAMSSTRASPPIPQGNTEHFMQAISMLHSLPFAKDH